MLTNKILADSLHVPLTRLRRWAKEFLPSDPKATRQSGYIREYSDNDGWFMYISGKIMEATGFTFRKTQKIMEGKLKPWMLGVGLAPDVQDVPILKGADAYLRYDCVLHFYIDEQSDDQEIPPIRVEGRMNRYSHKKKTDKEGKEFSVINETKITYWIVEPLTKKSAIEYFFRATVPSVSVEVLLSHFIRWVFGHGREAEWSRNRARIHPESELKKTWRGLKILFPPLDKL
jgi:hypothetical protein